MSAPFSQLLNGLPPQMRAMLPADLPSRTRTPEESLMVLVALIEGLALRGPDAANGLKISKTLDERGATIRIDLP